MMSESSCLTSLISLSRILLSQLSGHDTSASWQFTIVPFRHSLEKDTRREETRQCHIPFMKSRQNLRCYEAVSHLTCRRCADTPWGQCPLLAPRWRSRWDSLPLWHWRWGSGLLLPTSTCSSSLVLPAEPSLSSKRGTWIHSTEIH